MNTEVGGRRLIGLQGGLEVRNWVEGISFQKMPREKLRWVKSVCGKQFLG